MVEFKQDQRKTKKIARNVVVTRRKKIKEQEPSPAATLDWICLLSIIFVSFIPKSDKFSEHIKLKCHQITLIYKDFWYNEAYLQTDVYLLWILLTVRYNIIKYVSKKEPGFIVLIAFYDLAYLGIRWWDYGIFLWVDATIWWRYFRLGNYGRAFGDSRTL